MAVIYDFLRVCVCAWSLPGREERCAWRESQLVFMVRWGSLLLTVL